jgi:hypothetical protein
MSARRQIIAALSEDSLGGIATLADVDHAEHLVNNLVAEVRREDAERLLNERRNHINRAVFCDGIKHAADQLTQWADEDRENATAEAATATPGPTGRVAQLLDAIRTAQGHWTTVTAYRFYRDHLRGLDHIPNTQLRAVARGDLRDLAAWGHLLRHEQTGRQYYTLNSRKDGRS